MAMLLGEGQRAQGKGSRTGSMGIERKGSGASSWSSWDQGTLKDN